MADFLSEAAAAAKLAEAVAALPESLVVTDSEDVQAALAAREVRHRVARIELQRADDGVTVVDCPIAERVVVAVIGVETGRTVAAIAGHLRAAGVAHLTLAAAVLPRQTEHLLGSSYGQYVALLRPLAPRSLRWHVG